MSKMAEVMAAENKQRPKKRSKKKKRKKSASMDMSSEKAKKILRDGSVRGHKLSKKQRGLFGAIAGKGK